MGLNFKPRVNVFKGQIACDDNATDTAFIDPSFYIDSSEITDIDPFSNDSNVTSIELGIFDSSDTSSIIDSSVLIDCSI